MRYSKAPLTSNTPGTVAYFFVQPWGVFQTLCITYASEVCPVAMRGYLTTYGKDSSVLGTISLDVALEVWPRC
jgi:hypothetical protein